MGNGFLWDVDATLERITAHPEAHAVIEAGIRRALLRRFPYGVFYVVDEREIVVIAVMHSARDPKAW